MLLLLGAPLLPLLDAGLWEALRLTTVERGQPERLDAVRLIWCPPLTVWYAR